MTAYRTHFTAEYDGMTIELQVTVDGDGYAEIEEAFAVSGIGPKKHYIDVTELLSESYHREVLKWEKGPLGRTAVDFRFIPIGQYLLDRNSHQLIEDRAGALIDRARDEWEERMAAE